MERKKRSIRQTQNQTELNELTTEEIDEKIHALVAINSFLQAEQLAEYGASRKTIDYLVTTQLKIAKAEKNPWDSIRLIRECAYKAEKLGASEKLFDEILNAYLNAYRAIEGEYGLDPDLCLRCISHAKDIAKFGASKKTINALHDFCLEKGFNFSAQRIAELIKA
ncbi:hypothetical protein KJA14_02710 [Patescibacteria group bacterium]|nr:hypothetical protein [Patescibacteria group bacterium]